MTGRRSRGESPHRYARRGAVIAVLAAGVGLCVAASGTPLAARHRAGPVAASTAGSSGSPLGPVRADAAPHSGFPTRAATRAPSTPPARTSTPATPPAAEITALAADGIPLVALAAYHDAADRLARIDPGCGIQWWLLAGIGRVESDNGQYGGAVLHADGTTTPHIIGIALDGVHAAYIPAPPDGMALDGDAVYAHALGPMQFIPSTWAEYASDGNGDGKRDVFNIYDAALGAARYLCAAGGNLRTLAGQATAVLAYNHSASYLAEVLALAHSYQTGVTVTPTPPPNLAPPTLPPVNPGPPLALAPTPSPPGTVTPTCPPIPQTTTVSVPAPPAAATAAPTGTPSTSPAGTPTDTPSGSPTTTTTPTTATPTTATPTAATPTPTSSPPAATGTPTPGAREYAVLPTPAGLVLLMTTDGRAEAFDPAQAGVQCWMLAPHSNPLAIGAGAALITYRDGAIESIVPGHGNVTWSVPAARPFVLAGQWLAVRSGTSLTVLDVSTGKPVRAGVVSPPLLAAMVAALDSGG